MTKEDLVRLADMLDRTGNHKTASKIDTMLLKLSDDDYVKCIKCGHWYAEHHSHHRRTHCPKCGESNIELDMGERLA